jgi:hypothetical protein
MFIKRGDNKDGKIVKIITTEEQDEKTIKKANEILKKQKQEQEKEKKN